MHFTRLAVAAALSLAVAGIAAAQQDLNDLEMAHVAVTADDIDIRYAHLALALSQNQAVREFAETMIRDHTAVSERVVALAKRLNVQAQDNPMSRQLLEGARGKLAELSRLSGAAFDRAYAQNELDYHRTVNGVVADAFIPNIENAEVKAAFETALAIFKAHERHAEQLVQKVSGAGR